MARRGRGVIAILGSLLAAAAVACGPRASGEDASSIDVSAAPEQTAIADPEPIRIADDGWTFTLTPLARYVLRGVVLSRENYRFGWNARLSPCDVAMAWGELEAGDGWRRLDWSQDGRWYFWRWHGTEPFPNAVVVGNSSNTHVVPADSNLARAAGSLSRGDVAELVGELVAIEGRNGGDTVTWRSSLSRHDTGDGSCEVLYLRRLRVNGKVYE